MGPALGIQIDDWFRSGGIVVTASERASRSLAQAYHRRRLAEGLSAWPAPKIQTWTSLALGAWERGATGESMLLNSAQEQHLWAEIIRREPHLATVLDAPRQRMAALAMEAHELLCHYAPAYLSAKSRASWELDPKSFSGWLTAFEKACRENVCFSASRLPLDAVRTLQQDTTRRAPLLAVGFDRILPTQRALFDAWGSWQELEPDEAGRESHFFSIADERAELDACALWCMRHLADHPTARLLVISQQIGDRRGAIERAFLRHTGSDSLFEFSLGVPLGRIPLVHTAHLLLQWLDRSLPENDIDWLFSTGYLAPDPAETYALHATMRMLRDRGLARPAWSLTALMSQRSSSHSLPATWLRRMQRARHLLAALIERRQTAFAWTALVPDLLSAAGLPGERSLSSAEFQAWRRLSQALDTCGSLGFDGHRMAWSEFLAALARILDDTLFAPESNDAPIQIAGPAESAGLTADAIWFLGADEEAWPATGSTHPLLPLAVQRETRMPHATLRQDWDLAASVTRRILHSAPLVHCSFPARRGDSETRPSPLIAQLVAPPEPLPHNLAPPPAEKLRTLPFADSTHVPFPPAKLHGGSAVLTAQSQCPFKAFAEARLGAKGWDPAEFGLSPSQRGLLLHAVMHTLWAGPTAGLRSLNDLLACSDIAALVAGHVRRVFDEKLPGDVRDRMPHGYLDLESARLVRVLTEWLGYEATRLPFTVVETESSRTITLAGLSLDLRLDRIDRLNDGSLLVIDYKTGNVSPNAWQFPRPEDVQLPLYASFGLSTPPGGLVFAKVRIGNSEFAGRVRDARATLLVNAPGNSSLVKNALTDDALTRWKKDIEQLARDFVAGRADVDPRDYPRTCERCDLPALCRVHENRDLPDSDDACDEESDE